MQYIGGSKGGARDARPLGVQILSFSCSFRQKNCKTRMHSSRMHTACSLTISRRVPHTPPLPPCMPPQPHMPLTTMHAPLQPHTPPCNHAPPAAMHAPWQPCMPPSNHAHPLATMQAPGNHACPPATTHAPLWTEWLTDRCKNITFANFICGR